MTTKGTKEWSDETVNTNIGCYNNCCYCYAAGKADIFGTKKREDWENMVFKPNTLEAIAKRKKPFATREGKIKTIMIPSAHDTFEENVEDVIKVLKKLLTLGNPVLFVSKPRFSVIKKLCDELAEFQDLLEMRFTITSSNDALIQEYEGISSLFLERLKCLTHCFSLGFTTSVSIEPFLDSIYLVPYLINSVYPFVVTTIWIGRMNKKYCPVDKWDESKWEKDALVTLFNIITNNLSSKLDKIRFKDSFVNVIKDVIPYASQKVSLVVAT